MENLNSHKLPIARPRQISAFPAPESRRACGGLYISRLMDALVWEQMGRALTRRCDARLAAFPDLRVISDNPVSAIFNQEIAKLACAYKRTRLRRRFVFR